LIVAAPGATNVLPAGRLVPSGKKVPGGKPDPCVGTWNVVVVVVELSEAFGLITVVTVVVTDFGVGDVASLGSGTSTKRWFEIPLEVATCTSRTQRCLHSHSLGAACAFAVWTADCATTRAALAELTESSAALTACTALARSSEFGFVA
jgi:hypothetical protein